MQGHNSHSTINKLKKCCARLEKGRGWRVGDGGGWVKREDEVSIHVRSVKSGKGKEEENRREERIVF